jgi:CRISPR-associated protein Csd2
MTTLTTTSAHTDPKRRHDFVLLFDVTDGNPNGDPDAGNLPRVDPETMQGLVTDVAIKRKVRDYVAQVKEGEAGYDIYVKHRGILAREQERAYQGAPPSLRPSDDAKKWMCQTFFDVRLFGAVMTTGDSGQKDRSNRTLQWNCGQVRGPVQFKFARSIDPITPLDITITRVALTNPGDVDRASESAEDDGQAVSGQMGRKAIVPYGLYRAHGYFTPKFAADTGVTDPDLTLLWSALRDMWDVDHSAARGEMACRGLHVFTHENGLGNAPAHALFDLIRVKRRAEVETARRFDHYQVETPAAGSLEGHGFPGVTLTRLVG